MKKLLFVSVLLLGAGFAHADQKPFKVPLGVNNIPDATMRASGVDRCYLVTSTTPVLAVDSSSVTITDGWIYEIIQPSTGTVNSLYLELRDTNTANASSPRILPWIPAAAVGAIGQVQPYILLDPPVPFNNGLSVNLLPAGTAPGAGYDFGVCIKWKRQ